MIDEAKTTPPTGITSGRTLAHNTLWNLLGSGAPLLVALFSIPQLIKGLGNDRFGVLTLAWMVVGYFSLFDLGLGRAITKLVAEKLGGGQETEVPGIVWTALALLAVLGMAAIAVVATLSPWLVHRALKIPVVLQAETLKAFYLLGISIPIIISTAGLRGVLEAYQRFDLVNILRIPLGVFTFLGPLAVLPFSKSLFPVVAVLVGGRFLACGVHLLLCLRVVPGLRNGINVNPSMVRPLVSFGSWMTVSNIIGPLMVYFDRLFIGVLISMAAVAYYATPYELVTKLWLISGSVSSVLFPAFSTTLAQDRDRTALLYGRGINYIYFALFPLVLIIVTLSYNGLEFWLGDEFAKHSAPVLQWLAIGVFLNSLSSVPFALIQSAGRPDLIAKLYLIELPFYFLSLWWLIHAYGIKGAAVVWVLRITVDVIALFAMARRLLSAKASFVGHIFLSSVVALLFFYLGTLATSLMVKGLFLVGVLLIFIPSAWRLLLPSKDDSLTLKKFIGSFDVFRDKCL